MLKTILSISGKSGLYKLISSGKNMLIVESVDAAKKRMPAYAHDRITSLADIAMFTDSEDVPLPDIFESMKAKEKGTVCPIDLKKASTNELFDYFAQILPNYDQDRVHANDIKKLITWYNILINNGITEFKEESEEEKAEEAVVEEKVEEDKKVEKEVSAKKSTTQKALEKNAVKNSAKKVAKEAAKPAKATRNTAVQRKAK